MWRNWESHFVYSTWLGKLTVQEALRMYSAEERAQSIAGLAEAMAVVSDESDSGTSEATEYSTDG